jgi:hypothetical protein
MVLPLAARVIEGLEFCAGQSALYSTITKRQELQRYVYRALLDRVAQKLYSSVRRLAG